MTSPANVASALALAVLALCSLPRLHAQKPAAPVYAGPLDSARLATAVDGRLARARRTFETMLAAGGARTPANTLRPWDDALNLISEASGLADLAIYVYPDSLVRKEGARAVERVSKLRTELTTDPRAARVFQEIDTTRLNPADRRLVSLTRRDFRRSGALLPDAERARVRGHFETLDRLSTAFARSLAEDTTSFALEEKELAGMPEDWISRHKRDGQNRVIVTLQYPDYFPITTYASNRSLRHRMRIGFENRGRAQNTVLLDSLLQVREQAARLLGYRTWADYQAEPMMTSSADTIRAFIRRIKEAAVPANARLNGRLLAQLRKEDPSIDRVAIWDAAYARELLRRSEYNLDSRSVREYFPFKAVHDGVLGVMEELFQVEIRPVKLPVWHPSVKAYEMREKGRTLGRFYLDLHPRPAKFQHAAISPLRAGIAGRQLPEAMLLTNSPGGDPGDPGLMELDDVETFFHEFGHLVHFMFARQPYASVQWPAEQDFTEAPSMMLEELMHAPAVLRRLSRHVKTGRPIPDSLIARIEGADAFGRPRDAAFQAALSEISLELHSHPAARVNEDSVAHHALSTYLNQELPQPTHFVTSFPHIGSNGYGSVYYTYLWSQVISKDLWSAFDSRRPFDPGPAGRYRDRVLRPGGGKPSRELVEDFLGRPFEFASWKQWLEEGEREETVQRPAASP